MIDENNLIRGNLVQFRYDGRKFEYLHGGNYCKHVTGYIDKITRDEIYIGDECVIKSKGATIYHVKEYKKNRIGDLESKLSK